MNYKAANGIIKREATYPSVNFKILWHDRSLIHPLQWFLRYDVIQCLFMYFLLLLSAIFPSISIQYKLYSVQTANKNFCVFP